jgi:drug/metabolite transporter (DMT)-like permease
MIKKRQESIPQIARGGTGARFRGANVGFLLVILTSLLYGVMPAITQRAYAAGMTVETVLTGRYLIGTSLIWLFILVTKKPARVDAKSFWLMMLVGVNIFICVFSMTSSYQFLPGAIASLLVFMYIVIVNAIELITGKERPRPSRIVCLLLTVVGLIAVVYTPTGGSALNPRGILLALLAGGLYAVWALSMGAKSFRGFSAEVMMGYTLLVPTLANVVKCLLSGQAILPETPEQWLYILLLGLSPGFIAPVAFSTAVRLIGAGTASIINTSEPVFAYFAGLILMSDHLSKNAIFGGVLIIVGILFLNISENRRRDPSRSRIHDRS